jgi:hypothetical protein
MDEPMRFALALEAGIEPFSVVISRIVYHRTTMVSRELGELG